MSRRDTIIIAVLVNAGLLIVLFASALKTSTSEQAIVANPPAHVQEVPEPVLKKEAAPVMGDEVDRALQQFSQNAMAASTPAQPVVPQLPETSPSFADDLKALSAPAAAPVSEAIAMPAFPQESSAAEFVEIKVKKGDVLEKIARQHHTTTAEIMRINKLTSTNLRIGQVLKIPTKTIKKAEAFPIASSSQATVYYTVKKGDSPWTIAVKNHIKPEELLRLNQMTEEQARHMKPGDKLRIK